MLSLQSLPVQSITAKLVWWKEGTCSSSKVITPSGGVLQRQWSRWFAGFPQTRLLPPGADYGQISEETWQYLLGIYGGGPEIAVRQTVAPADPDGLHGERKIEAETRALWDFKGEVRKVSISGLIHWKPQHSSQGLSLFWYKLTTCTFLLAWQGV